MNNLTSEQWKKLSLEERRALMLDKSKWTKKDWDEYNRTSEALKLIIKKGGSNA